VKPQHLQAFLWLRWRLFLNQLRRGGIANILILALLSVVGAFTALGLFVTGLLVGLLAFEETPPAILMYVCDGIVGVFLFAWTMGLLIDLQRSEALTLDKFLHLPVSAAGVFVINYLSSLFSVTLLFFIPATVGLGIGLILGKGPAFLLYFPLLAAFLLMVTALTYQFQGWLASLMVNVRRRRTMIVLLTASFILLAQLPNIAANVFQPWMKERQDKISAGKSAGHAEVERAHKEHKISDEEFLRRQKQIDEDYAEQMKEDDEQTKQQVERAAQIINLVLPPGWFPLGVGAAAQGEFLPAVLGILGLLLIGAASLWRSYTTTIRMYKGQFRSRKKRPGKAPVAVVTLGPGKRFLEKEIPGLSERASAITLSSFQSFLRAPETKMMLLSPIILLFIFGSMLVARRVELPEGVRPLLPFGAMAMVMLTMIQFVGNQFGFDRSGFRVFVLCASPRREVLLGKNLALAPFALGFGLVAVTFLQIVYPTRLDYFLAAIPQLISVFLLYCLLANWLSIFAPMPMAPGSFKPTHYKGIPILIHFAFLFVFPIVLAPTLLPVGIALMLRAAQWIDWFPICLVLSAAECVGIIYLYRLLLATQGDLLQAREKRILEIVTKKAE
jgi:ABC-2 type transport system permease protein